MTTSVAPMFGDIEEDKDNVLNLVGDFFCQLL